MDPRLADHFERELRHVREMRREFAGRFPKVAGRLSIDGLACDDPYVERLTESFAFLTARIQLELEQSFPAFSQAMLEVLCPACLSPVPSASVVQLRPDASDANVAAGYLLPRGRLMRSEAPRGQTPCTWRTAHELTLWPIRLASASYHTSRELGPLNLPETLSVADGTGRRRPVRAAVRLVFESVGAPITDVAAAGLNRLPIFLPGEDDPAGPQRLWEHLIRHGGPMLVRAGGAASGRVVESAVRRYGFDPEQAMIPPGPRLAEAHRLVLEYLTLPERFRFIELVGLKRALITAARMTKQGETVTTAEIVLPLLAEEPQLEGVVTANDFALYCTPVVNLFEREADRQRIDEQGAEQHLVVDRTCPLDYEVWRVNSVTGFVGGAEPSIVFSPMFESADPVADAPVEGRGHFTSRRLSRPPSDVERREGSMRSRYAGTEIYITLAGGIGGTEVDSLRQLGAKVWCTNRDLPLSAPMSGERSLTLMQGEPVQSIKSVSGLPTPPRAGPVWVSAADLDGNNVALPAAWQLVNALGLNHVPLASGQGTRSAEPLRTLLRLLGGGDALAKAAASAVLSATAKPVVRRVRTGDLLGFVRGVQVTLDVDEDAHPPGGPVLLGAVLEQIFARSVAINSFVETVVRSPQRGTLSHWRPSLGRRYLL